MKHGLKTPKPSAKTRKYQNTKSDLKTEWTFFRVFVLSCFRASHAHCRFSLLGERRGRTGLHRVRHHHYNEGMQAILDVAPSELTAWLAERGQPRMRLKQIRRWLVLGRAESFEQMTDLPQSLRT